MVKRAIDPDFPVDGEEEEDLTAAHPFIKTKEIHTTSIVLQIFLSVISLTSPVFCANQSQHLCVWKRVLDKNRFRGLDHRSELKAEFDWGYTEIHL